MLEPGHAGEDRKFASVTRYTMRTGELSELLHIVDDVFADQIEAMDGFDAYHALDCGGQGVTISLFAIRRQRTPPTNWRSSSSAKSSRASGSIAPE
jgi:hypothetical protein